MRILSVSSRVATGEVGNSLLEAAFAKLAPAVELHAIDTVTWSGPGNQPGRVGTELPADLLRSMLELAPAADLLFVGYLRTRDQVEALARWLDRHPSRLVLDPVMGDGGRLYIPTQTAAAIRDELVPRAWVLLPNLTEARWLLTGATAGTETFDEELRLAAIDRRQWIVVKSATATEGRLGLLIASPDGAVTRHEHDAIPLTVSGTGDLFSGILLAYLALGGELETAAHSAARAVQRALEAELARPLGLRTRFLVG
jgi:pyridoxine kinase